MGVASGCGEQEVGVASGSGWNLWVWLLGLVVRRYIDFLILLIPTPFFCSSIPTFCSFLKCFFIIILTSRVRIFLWLYLHATLDGALEYVRLKLFFLLKKYFCQCFRC